MDKSDNFASECEILWGVILTGRITELLLTLKVFLNVLLFPSRVTCLQDIRPPNVSPRTWRMRISLILSEVVQEPEGGRDFYFC